MAGIIKALGDSRIIYFRHVVGLSSAGKKGMKRFLEEAALYEEFSDLLVASYYRLASVFAKLRLTHRAHVLVSSFRIRRLSEIRAALQLIFADGGMAKPERRAAFLQRTSEKPD